jgi:hypothetical protein
MDESWSQWFARHFFHGMAGAMVFCVLMLLFGVPSIFLSSSPLLSSPSSPYKTVVVRDVVQTGIATRGGAQSFKAAILVEGDSTLYILDVSEDFYVRYRGGATVCAQPVTDIRKTPMLQNVRPGACAGSGRPYPAPNEGGN